MKDVSKLEHLYPECLNDGRIVSAGVGVKEGELAAFKAIAESIGVKPNALMRLALRDWLNRVRNGLNISEYIYEPPAPDKKVIIPEGHE
jgi:hypothetical protein